MNEGILGAIASPQLADIAGALNYRQSVMDKDEQKRKEITRNKLIAQAIPNMAEDSPIRKLFEIDPQAGALFAKQYNIPLNDGEAFEKFRGQVRQLASAADADPRIAIDNAKQMQAENQRNGVQDKNLDRWVSQIDTAMQNGDENGIKTQFNALHVMDQHLNSDYHEKQALSAQTKDINERKMKVDERQVAVQEREANKANDPRQFAGQVVNSNEGLLVFDPSTKKMVRATIDGKPIVGAAYDPTTAAAVAGAKTSAEVGTKQSLDLADKYYQKIAPINNAIANFDDAVRLIDSGAGTGKIESLLPSFRQSSIELDNVRRNLGLNVIQNTTFGALSEGELKLALDTGLPTGLNGPELKDWISRKKDAQVKMRDYLENAVSYLGEGHSIADLSKQQRSEREKTATPATPPSSGGATIGRFQVKVHQ